MRKTYPHLRWTQCDLSRVRFPDPRDATLEGIVAIGGSLEPEIVRQAYRQGIFPWPVEGWPLTWFSPAERAVLDFKDLHVPRRLARVRKQAPFSFTIDRDFPAVINSCARVRRPGETGTWITPQMIRAYSELNRQGHAHSVEAWEGERFVGGIYGVDADGAFAGESMFFFSPNASKLAFLYLVEHLQARGLDWIDIQVMTPHMKTLGAHVISRDEFLERLSQTRGRGLKLF